MQVVILAAGRGERFLSHGHMVPKPLIYVDGKRMISRALTQAAEVTLFPVVVCPQYLMADLKYHTPAEVHPDFVPVKHIQQGAAYSLLTAAGMLKDDQPVMVLDCDTIFTSGMLAGFSDMAEAAFAEGYGSAVLCFKPLDDSARYSFVQLDGATVTAVMEKVRISDVATCGVHAFASWDVARRAIFEMAILQIATNGEYYLAPAHNNVARTVAVIIDTKDFRHVGTPLELETYEQTISTAE